MSVPTDDKKSERERLSNLIVSHESQAESLLGFHKDQKKIVEGLKAQLAELNGERALTIASDPLSLFIHPLDSDARDSIVLIDKGSCTRLGILPADLARHIVNKREIDHRLSIQELERKVVWLVRIIRQNFVDLKSAPSLVTSLFQALDHLDAAKLTEDKQPEKDLTLLKDAVIKAIRGYSDRSVETNWYDVAMALKNLDMAERQLAEANTGTEAPVTEASALTVAEEETDNHIKEKLNELDLVKDFLMRVYQFGVVIPTEDNLAYAARENYDCLRAIMRKTAKLLGIKDRQLPAALEQVKSDTKKTSGNITEKLSAFLRKRQKHVEATEPGVREARLQEQLMEMDTILRETITLNSVRDRRDEFCKELDNARAELASMTRSRNHYENLYNESQAKLGNTLPKVDILQERVERVEARNEELRAEVERLQGESESYLSLIGTHVAERDALQAHIDAGVGAWEKWKQQCGSLWLWAFPGVTASQEWSDVCNALDGSYTPLDHIVDPNKMVDERKGKADRREISCDDSFNARIAAGRKQTRRFDIDAYDCNGTMNCARSNDRRKTPGTRADRRQA